MRLLEVVGIGARVVWGGHNTCGKVIDEELFVTTTNFSQVPLLQRKAGLETCVLTSGRFFFSGMGSVSGSTRQPLVHSAVDAVLGPRV